MESGWIPLWNSLPEDLRFKAEIAAKQIWRVVGKIHVGELDLWYYEAKLSYIKNADGSPKVITLSLIEGDLGQAVQEAAYIVDITRKRIKIKQTGTYTPIPPECMPTIQELEDWVERIPERAAERRRQEQERMRQHYLRQQQEARRRQLEEDEAARAYEERLLQVADHDTTTLGKRRRPSMRHYQLGFCQVCGLKLSRCSDCKIASCAASQCPGGVVDGLRACESHSDIIICNACRLKQADATASYKQTLATCPNCSTLHCPADLYWCTGEVKGKEPQHIPKVVACPACHEDTTGAVKCQYRRCSHQVVHGNPSLRVRACADCVEQGTHCDLSDQDGHQQEWYCSFCADSAFRTCPSCKETVCPSNQSHRCSGCGAIDSCKYCVNKALDAPQHGEKQLQDPSAGLLIFEKPECGCPEMCRDCMPDPEVEGCSYCVDSSPYCVQCAYDATCADCGDVRGCPSCVDNHHCPDCGQELLYD